MQVVRLTSSAELQPWIPAWNGLARGVPFRRWEWLESWWNHYGPGRAGDSRQQELFVLAVLDSDRSLAGLAPWYIERSASRGRVVRFLGSGEVCSEYLSLLCRGGEEETVAQALADWLTAAGRSGSESEADGWDAIKLSAVECGDLAITRLLDQLALHGNDIYRRPGMNCWRLALPESWEAYLKRLSKSHRKQLRRMDRDFFRTGRAVIHWVHDQSHLDHALGVLVELHQRRWRGRGKAGCFASPRFLEFHREVARRMLAADCLSMSWMEVDGRPAAAEYHLRAGGIVYAYQSGIAPEWLPQEPGRLSHLATIRRAIERGDAAFDFLRGDEPYKAHLRAVPRGTFEASAVPARRGARLRQSVSAAGGSVVGWLKSGWQLAGNLLAE